MYIVFERERHDGTHTNISKYIRQDDENYYANYASGGERRISKKRVILEAKDLMKSKKNYLTYFFKFRLSFKYQKTKQHYVIIQHTKKR